MLQSSAPIKHILTKSIKVFRIVRILQVGMLGQAEAKLSRILALPEQD